MANKMFAKLCRVRLIIFFEYYFGVTAFDIVRDFVSKKIVIAESWHQQCIIQSFGCNTYRTSFNLKRLNGNMKTAHEVKTVTSMKKSHKFAVEKTTNSLYMFVVCLRCETHL